MKKTRTPTPSSTQISSDNGKALKKLRLKAVEKEIERIGGKTNYLMRSLAEGDLPEGVLFNNLIRSQRANASEIAEIKVYVQKMTKGVEKFAGIPEMIACLHNSVLNCIDKLQDLNQFLKQKKNKDGNKGKRQAKTSSPANPAGG